MDSNEHICKYCGVKTIHPDEECYMYPKIRKVTVKSIPEDEIMNHALRFTFKTCPTGEKGELLDFDKRKKTFYACVKWFVENYHPIENNDKTHS